MNEHLESMISKYGWEVQSGKVLTIGANDVFRPDNFGIFHSIDWRCVKRSIHVLLDRDNSGLFLGQAFQSDLISSSASAFNGERLEGGTTLIG